MWGKENFEFDDTFRGIGFAIIILAITVCVTGREATVIQTPSVCVSGSSSLFTTVDLKENELTGPFRCPWGSGYKGKNWETKSEKDGL